LRPIPQWPVKGREYPSQPRSDRRMRAAARERVGDGQRTRPAQDIQPAQYSCWERFVVPKVAVESWFSSIGQQIPNAGASRR